MLSRRQSRRRSARHGDHGWISWADIVTCCLGAVCLSAAVAAQDQQNNLVRALGQISVVSGAERSSATMQSSSAGVISIDPLGVIVVKDQKLPDCGENTERLRHEFARAIQNEGKTGWLLVADERLPLGKVQRIEMILQSMNVAYSRVMLVSKQEPERTQ